MATRGPKGGAAREAFRAEEELRPMLTEGFSSEEWAEALRMIGGVEQTGRARVASVMGRGGGAFDPRAFARAAAPLAGGTQRAIGGLKAREAEMKRRGLMQWMEILQRRAGEERERRATSRAGVTSGMGSMFGFATQAMQAGGRGPATPGYAPPTGSFAAPPASGGMPPITAAYGPSDIDRSFGGSPSYDWMHTPAWNQ